MSSVIEAIEKIPLKLLSTINDFRFKVGLPVEGISFESSDKLFDQQISPRTNSFTCFNEVSNKLF